MFWSVSTELGLTTCSELSNHVNFVPWSRVEQFKVTSEPSTAIPGSNPSIADVVGVERSSNESKEKWHHNVLISLFYKIKNFWFIYKHKIWWIDIENHWYSLGLTGGITSIKIVDTIFPYRGYGYSVILYWEKKIFMGKMWGLASDIWLVTCSSFNFFLPGYVNQILTPYI